MVDGYGTHSVSARTGAPDLRLRCRLLYAGHTGGGPGGWADRSRNRSGEAFGIAVLGLSFGTGFGPVA